MGVDADGSALAAEGSIGRGLTTVLLQPITGQCIRATTIAGRFTKRALPISDGRPVVTRRISTLPRRRAVVPETPSPVRRRRDDGLDRPFGKRLEHLLAIAFTNRPTDENHLPSWLHHDLPDTRLG